MISFKEFGSTLERLDELISNGRISKKEIASRLGYKNQSGLTNAIRRGSIKLKEVYQISEMMGMNVLRIWPDKLQSYLGNQSIFKVAKWISYMEEVDELQNEATSFRRKVNMGGGR